MNEVVLKVDKMIFHNRPKMKKKTIEFIMQKFYQSKKVATRTALLEYDFPTTVY